MNNVYEDVNFFYNENPKFDSVIKKNWVEKFLRKKAWSGRSDQDMKKIWRQLEYFFSYIEWVQLFSVGEMRGADYAKAVLWIAENNPEFVLSESGITHFFFVIKTFYQYLDAELNTAYATGAYSGLKYFYVKEKFEIPKLDKDYDYLYQADELSVEAADHLNSLLEGLLNKIGTYYKDVNFLQDFDRALSLYSGPLNITPEPGDNEGDEYWLGFWDYFLFDYHLIENDLSPLKYFYDENEDTLRFTELNMLQDLLQAKFTVFFINHICDDDMVECIDLFTGEKIYLPQPDYGICDYKKVLLYGHIYAKGVVLLNYITSVHASLNLRKRIKNEVLRQYEVYKYQNKKATLSEFFARHPGVVRHTIDILVRLSTVNVVSPNLLNSDFPKIDANARTEDEEARQILQWLAKRYDFSLYTKTMLFKMWEDVCSVLPVSDSASIRAVSVFVSFSTLNGADFIDKNLLFKLYDITKEDFQHECEKIANFLHLRIFDPRYLTEEGFIRSLYSL